MVPRKVEKQADARRVIASPSSRAPVSRHAGMHERPVRLDQVDGRDRSALPRASAANSNQRQHQLWPVVCKGRRPKATRSTYSPLEAYEVDPMKSHKRRTVFAIVIAIAALVLQVRAIAANPKLHASGARAMGAAAVAAAGSAAKAAAPPALSLTPAEVSFDAEAGRGAPGAQSLA